MTRDWLLIVLPISILAGVFVITIFTASHVVVDDAPPPPQRIESSEFNTTVTGYGLCTFVWAYREGYLTEGTAVLIGCTEAP